VLDRTRRVEVGHSARLRTRCRQLVARYVQIVAAVPALGVKRERRHFGFSRIITISPPNAFRKGNTLKHIASNFSSLRSTST
jgi:hypothetical protein